MRSIRQRIRSAADRRNAIRLFGDLETANRERPEGAPAFQDWPEVVYFVRAQLPGDPWYCYQYLFS